MSAFDGIFVRRSPFFLKKKNSNNKNSSGSNSNNFDPKLHVRKTTPLPPAPNNVETAIDKFEAENYKDILESACTKQELDNGIEEIGEDLSQLLLYNSDSE